MRRYRIPQYKKRTDIEMTPLKETIEEIFSPNNIDVECQTIADKIYDYGNVMKSYVASGDTSTAVTIFLEVA